VRITREKLARLASNPRITMRDWLLARHPLPVDPPVTKFFPRVAMGPAGEAVYAELISAFRDAGLPFMTGAAQDRWARAVHFPMSHHRDVIRLLARMSGDPRLIYAYEKTPTESNAQFVERMNAKRLPTFSLCPVERIGYELDQTTFACSTIEFNFWHLFRTYAGEYLYQAPNQNGVANRIREDTFLELSRSRASLDEAGGGRLYEVDFPIDAVFTWVDDQDEEWQREKAHFAGSLVEYTAAQHRSGHAERWRNRDELRYSLRSIEMFAPFIRQIFLVTNGQVPKWLDDTGARIRVVTHQEIYRNRDCLPTFNSSGIETQLHHIEGLAEHFLYFNDDFFLGDFCVPEDFFFANGAMKFFCSDQYAFPRDIDEHREAYIIADANAIDLMNRDIGKSGSNIMMHVPYPSRKSLLERLEQRYQNEFDACAAERFRSPNDVRPIAFWQYHAGFAEGIAFPSIITHRYLSLWKPTIAEQMNNVYRNRAFKTFCINDVGVQPQNVAASDRLVHKFLANYFPFPADFERPAEDRRARSSELSSHRESRSA
jgi:hypothetical protein